MTEPAFSTIKNEFCHHYSFTTRQETRRTTMGYIEAFYNGWRPRTYNQRLPPATVMANFDTQNQQQLVAA